MDKLETLKKQGAARWRVTAAAVLFLTSLGGCNSRFLRSLRWVDADTGDLYRFPTRAIPTGPGVFTFSAATGRPLRLAVRAPHREAERGEDVDSLLDTRGTYALLVIRHATLISVW